MDVRMPDGTIVRNVPDNITKEDLLGRYQAFQAPKDEPQERGFMGSLARQAGLTARAGIKGLGGFLSLPGTIADAITPESFPKFRSNELFDRASDSMGLPKPEGAWERVGGAGAEAMAGMGGMAKTLPALARGASPVTRAVLEQFGGAPSTLASSAAGSGIGGQIARENDVGPMGQLAASFAGGAAAPASMAAMRGLAGPFADIGASIAASGGHQKSIDRIAKEVALNAAKGQREQQLAALANRQRDIPGYEPTVPQALAAANIGKPGQFGGATIRLGKDLSGAQGAQDVLPGNVRAQQIALDQYKALVRAQTSPMREEALSKVRGLTADPIASRIDAILQVPGVRASDVASKTLSSVKEKITSLGGEDGIIHPSDLYTVRKEIGNTVSRFSKETQNWDKRMTSGLEKQIQQVFDDAIEGAGGTGWKDYLRAYSSGMKKMEYAEAAATEAKKIGVSVKGGPLESVARGEVPQLPTLLSRPMMATNWALKKFSQGAQDPIIKELAQRMTDPEEYMKLLALPPKDPLRMKVDQVVRNALFIDAIADKKRRSNGEN